MKVDELVKDKKLVLLDFFATWCGPCMTMMPVLDDISSRFKSAELEVIKIDVDLNLEFALEQKIMGVPTLALFKDGKEVWRDAGTFTASALSTIIQKYLI